MADFWRRIVLIGFFASGITGLVYEGIWIRMLTLVVGGTTAALTTVLIAFMGGLALGSFLLGGVADKAARPLRIYAIIEILIGLYAIGLPTLYESIPSIYRALHALDPHHGPLFHTLRFSLALTFFGIPATLMGGTLPLIVKALSCTSDLIRVTVAEVYAINTLGATIGAFLTGFVVIPQLGLNATLYITAGVNIAIGAAFYFLLSHVGASTQPPTPADSTFADSTPATPNKPPPSAFLESPINEGRIRRRPIFLLIFFFMGASSLAYEVLWHRLLGLSFGNSVYSVSTMLTSFLLGIALGSWYLRTWKGLAHVRWSTLGWLELTIAISAPITAWLLTIIPHAVQYLFLLPYLMTRLAGDSAADIGFWMMQFLLFCTATLTMIIPTSLMGASFPLAVQLYAREDIGKSVGRVYASNTFGSIVGLSLTGFVLVEAMGTRASTLGWSIINGALGVTLLQMEGSLKRFSRRQLVWGSVGLFVSLVLLPPWNLHTLTSGVYYHIIELATPTLEGDIVFHQEDDMGLVSLHLLPQVDHPDPTYTMKVNGKFMAGGGNRVPIMQQMAHIPVFMRGDGAKNALVIGLGGGYTVEATLMHAFERVDVAEISEAVIEGAKHTRPKIFADPRLQVIAEDARSLLLTGSHNYDVIISETSDPWMTGVANLYTQECFEWIRDRLAPGGIFGTWLQTRHKRIEDVRTILRTVQSVFPHFAVFQLAEGDTLLVMANEPLKCDAHFLRRHYEELRPQMLSINITSPWALLARMVMGENSSAAYLQGAEINTDDLPIIEFRTPRSINIGLKGKEVWDDLEAHAPQKPDLPLLHAEPGDDVRWEIHRAVHLKWYDQALTLAQNPEITNETGYLQARALFGLKRFPETLDLLDRLPAEPHSAYLKAGALAFTHQFGALREHLAHGMGWPESPTNDWETRLAFRRKQLLDNFPGND